MSSREQQKAEARAAREAAERDAATRAARTRRMQLLGGVLVAAVAIVAVVVIVSSSGGKKKAAAPTAGPVPGAAAVTREFQGIPQQGTVLGKPDAPVTLVEFGDLKCPACQQFALTSFPAIIQRFVRTGRLRVEFRPQTFIGAQTAPGDSGRAAAFALAAGKQGKFWNFAELFYANQQDETTRYVTDDFLRRVGRAIPGLDVAKALSGRSNPAITATLNQAQTSFTSAGFNSTPSFLLGHSGGVLKPYNVTSLDQLGAAIDKLK